MANVIHRDCHSAWIALRDVGGLDIDDRDKDLIDVLRNQLDPTAPDLESALAGATTDQFLQALFAAIQPFASMFKDILDLFQKADAIHGQSQWRVSVGDEYLDFKHFEEFIEHWNFIEAEFEVPALDRSHAFIMNDVRAEIGGFEYLIEGMEHGKPPMTGLPDVDDWLAEYDAGRYKSFPSSIMPQNFPAGLSDAATILLAAVTILRARGLTRAEMLEEHRARRYQSVEDDALHPWTIAQSETDFWLRSHIGYLANIRRQPELELIEVASKLVEQFAMFPRRRIPGKIEVKQLERLLSLPVWKQRYETYGVWIATRIIESLDDHMVLLRSDNGELKLAFSEARIADIETASPKLSLFAERRVALSNPQGKSRTASTQPDFGIWTQDDQFPECVLVVEVKHYKKRSRRNFRDALIDYSRAHPQAMIVLVNYGPVGTEFSDLPEVVAERCRMIGPLTPASYKTLAEFRDLVRKIVGNPVSLIQSDDQAAFEQIVALDVSASMDPILASKALQEFLGQARGHESKVAMIDQDIRSVIQGREINHWLTANTLGSSTSLAAPIKKLLERYAQVVVITDDDGMHSLKTLNISQMPSPFHETSGAIFVRVTR
jgi:hypothetical protein